MRLEIATAVDFLAGKLIGNRVPLDASERLQRELAAALCERYADHWHPEEPLRGNGYRAVQSMGGRLDAVLVVAFRHIGLGESDARRLLPSDFIVWIDPACVSVRLGQDGSVWDVQLLEPKAMRLDLFPLMTDTAPPLEAENDWATQNPMAITPQKAMDDARTLRRRSSMLQDISNSLTQLSPPWAS